MGLSISITPMTSPSLCSGTTVSDTESVSQAMCPGKAWTSGTTRTSSFFYAVPQTPRPFSIRTQAAFP